MPWEDIKEGIEQKVFVKHNQQLRLLKFKNGFVENEWCTKGHIGYVLNGSLTIQFKNKKVKLQNGDGLWIEPGEGHQHKVSLEKNEHATLVLFEEA